MTLRELLAAATLPEDGLEVMDCEPDDELHDLFPGTGAVTRAWEAWCSQPRLDLYPNEEMNQSDVFNHSERSS